MRFPGGKQRLVKQIAELAPKDFLEYREPFVGGGSVYFHFRSLGLGKEFWLNDLFEPVANFWKQLAKNPDEVRKYVQCFKTDELNGRKLFNGMKEFYATCPKEQHEDDLAAAFFIINRISFSGLGFSGGYSKASFEGRFNKSHIAMLDQCGTVLNGTKVTNLDYSELLSKDGEKVFIYLDPPYDIESNNLYGDRGNAHKTFDHEKFAYDCANSKHKWLITYNDNELIRKLFSPFATITEVPVKYSMNSTAKNKQELFITNY